MHSTKCAWWQQDACSKDPQVRELTLYILRIYSNDFLYSYTAGMIMTMSDKRVTGAGQRVLSRS